MKNVKHLLIAPVIFVSVVLGVHFLILFLCSTLNVTADPVVIAFDIMAGVFATIAYLAVTIGEVGRD